MIALPAAVRTAIDRLESAGYPAWAVGGCVRDSLRGLPPHDWDLTTAARPEAVCAVFAGERVLETGIRHGTVTVLLDGMPLEITTYRAEGAYSDGRRPDRVTFIDRIEDDLARRDFTVNAMAYSPVRGLCDPFGGRADLERGLLRAVGDPDARFTEDGLRILRGARFESKTGFSIEPETARAMRRQLARLDGVAAERVFAELTGLLTGRWVGRALRTERDVIARALPEVTPMFGLCQHNPHHRYDVWEHTVRAVEAAPAEPALRWAMLLHDSGKPACYTIDSKGVGHFKGHPAVSRALAEQAFERLRAGHALRDEVLDLVELHDYPLGQDEKTVRRRLARLGEARVRRLLLVKKCECTGQDTYDVHLAELQQTERLVNAVLAADACLSLRDLAVSGRDLTALGLHGRAVGETLRWLLAQVVDGALPNDPETLRGAAAQRKEERL